MSREPEPKGPPAGPRSRALEWVVAHDAVDAVFAEVKAGEARRRRRRAGAGAMAGLAAVAALAVLGWPRELNPSAAAPRAVIVAESPRQTLADGSVVELRDGARIEVEFSGQVRRVKLRAGEAHFQVRRDPARPFVVVAGEVEVRAIGTAFAVQHGAGEVEIVVTEGRVAVEEVAPARDAAATAPLVGEARMLAHLEAGKRARIARKPDAPVAAEVEHLSADELSQRLAWRIPRLDLTTAPLAEALPLFNRHARVPLELGDPGLGALEISCVLRADNTEALLRVLADEFGVKAERRADRIVLRR